MLQKNRQVLEKIVEELLEFEILTGKVKSCNFGLPDYSNWFCCLSDWYLF